jgi:hypothetical protein
MKRNILPSHVLYSKTASNRRLALEKNMSTPVRTTAVMTNAISVVAMSRQPGQAEAQ